jgi:hypothetical protein
MKRYPFGSSTHARARLRENPTPSAEECRKVIAFLLKGVDSLTYAPLFRQENDDWGGAAMWRYRGRSALYDISVSGRPTGYRLVLGTVEYDSYEPLHTLLILNPSSEVVARFPFSENREVERLLEEAGITYFNRRRMEQEEVPVLMKYALTDPRFEKFNKSCSGPATREAGWYEMDMMNYVLRRPPEFHSGQPRDHDDDD